MLVRLWNEGCKNEHDSPNRPSSALPSRPPWLFSIPPQGLWFPWASEALLVVLAPPLIGKATEVGRRAGSGSSPSLSIHVGPRVVSWVEPWRGSRCWGLHSGEFCFAWLVRHCLVSGRMQKAVSLMGSLILEKALSFCFSLFLDSLQSCRRVRRWFLFPLL